jgi:hypothetical protein
MFDDDRDRDQGADRARGDLADGPLEMVAAALTRPRPSGEAVTLGRRPAFGESDG